MGFGDHPRPVPHPGACARTPRKRRSAPPTAARSCTTSTQRRLPGGRPSLRGGPGGLNQIRQSRASGPGTRAPRTPSSPAHPATATSAGSGRRRPPAGPRGPGPQGPGSEPARRPRKLGRWRGEPPARPLSGSNVDDPTAHRRGARLREHRRQLLEDPHGRPRRALNWFSHAREHPVVRRVSDLIDGLDDLASKLDEDRRKRNR